MRTQIEKEKKDAKKKHDEPEPWYKTPCKVSDGIVVPTSKYEVYNVTIYKYQKSNYKWYIANRSFANKREWHYLPPEGICKKCEKIISADDEHVDDIPYYCPFCKSALIFSNTSWLKINSTHYERVDVSNNDHRIKEKSIKERIRNMNDEDKPKWHQNVVAKKKKNGERKSKRCY